MRLGLGLGLNMRRTQSSEGAAPPDDGDEYSQDDWFDPDWFDDEYFD